MHHLPLRHARVIIRPGYLRTYPPVFLPFRPRLPPRHSSFAVRSQSESAAAVTASRVEPVLLGTVGPAPSSAAKRAEPVQNQLSTVLDGDDFFSRDDHGGKVGRLALDDAALSASSKEGEDEIQITDSEDQQAIERMNSLYHQLKSDTTCLSLPSENEMVQYYTQYHLMENWWRNTRSRRAKSVNLHTGAPVDTCVSDALKVEVITRQLTPEESEVLHRELVLDSRDSYTSRYQSWRYWLPRFQAIYLPFDTRHAGHDGSSVQMKDCSRLDRTLGIVSKDITTLRRNWLTTTLLERDRLWPHIVIWLMQNHPERVMPVLSTISRGVNPPPGATLDVLLYMASYWWQRESDTAFDSKITHQRVDSILRIFERGRLQRGMLGLQRQKLIYLLTSRCTLPQLKRLYALISDRITGRTRLHIAQAFGEFGDYRQALALLRAALQEGVTHDSPDATKVLNSILRHSILDPDGYHANAWIIQQALDQGIVLSIHVHNTLMMNAVDTGDYDTVFKMFTLLEQSGAQADAHTYTIILTAAKRAKNQEFQRQYLSAALRSSSMSSVLATEILATCFNLLSSDKHLTKSQKRAELIQMYCDLFDAGPLLTWGIIEESEIQASGHQDSSNRMPTGGTLVRMLGMLDLLSPTRKQQRSASDITELWNRLQYLIRDTSPQNRYRNLFASLTVSDRVQNLLLLRARKHPSLLEFSTNIVKQFTTLPEVLHYVQDGSLGESPHQIGASPNRVPPAPVSAKTWTTLMSNYNIHRQHKAAQMVFKLMQDRGLEPDETTWNKYFHALVEPDNLEGLATALNERIASGQANFESIGKILRRVSDLDELERIMSRRKIASQA